MSNSILGETGWRLRVFDSLSFPTLILKPNKIILTANRIFLEKYGYCIEEVAGRTCHEIFYGKATCPDHSCPFAKVLMEKKGQSIVRSHFSLTGKKIWEDRVFSPILDESGEVAYVLESVRDITQLKTLEKVLRKTQLFFEKLIQSSAMAIVAADSYGEILLMNPMAEDLFGYVAEDAMHHIPTDRLYPPGVAKEIMRQLRAEAYGGKGKISGLRTTIIDKNGQEIPVELTASIIYEDDDEIATMGIYQDLRDRLEVERRLAETRSQLAQSEKMASIGQLAAGVAHELNNPLTSILFDANMILEGTAAGDANRESLELVIDDVYRCKDIVKNLLAYSRQTNPLKDIIQMDDLAEQSLALIRDQKLFANVKVVKNLSGEMMLVHVDKNQISQVIINLVMNAVAAMDGSGTLTLRTYRNKTTQEAFLEVSDTGSGISEENLSKIFDPFFTTKELGKGTGLGLSTAFGNVNENKGKISVKSTDSDGTTFLMQFPLYQTSNDY
jgi:two-component system, NtrC family, sensor kinase